MFTRMAKEEMMNSQKMGTMPVGRLLASMSIPAMFSMLIQSLYNVVDSIFVAQIGENALTAVSVAYPLQMLVLAFALGIGVGTNSLIARKLGEGCRQEASWAAENGIFLAVMAALASLVCGIFFAGGYIRMMSTNEEVILMGTQYITVVMTCSFGMFVEITCSKSLQATGNMIVPMISQLVGALTNIILDPIMIFGLFGFPKLGVLGAAIATVAGQILAMCYVIVMFIRKEHDIQVHVKGFRPRKESVLGICKVGLPTTVMNAVGSLTITGINAILMGFSSTAVAILGIYFKLQSFVFMPVFGLTQGAMPIMGYNFGADNKKRFMHTLRLSFIVSFCIMLVGTLLFWIFPRFFLTLFNANESMMEMGVTALRIISLSFVGASFGIIMTSMFQAIGHGVKSLMMSVLRQLVFIIPAAYLLGRFFGLNAVWASYPIAEYLCVIIFLPIAVLVVKKEFRRKDAQQELLDIQQQESGTAQ